MVKKLHREIVKIEGVQGTKVSTGRTLHWGELVGLVIVTKGYYR